jgi:predicted phosphodiesterase
MKYLIALVIFMSILNIASSQEDKPLLTFGMVTDIHYADIPNIDQKAYNKSLDKLKECIDTMNQHSVDFLIELGDFKDQSHPASEEKTLVYLFRAEKVFATFNGLRYHVLGNHDVDCISKKQFLSVAKNTGINEDQTYYSFDRKGVHFIVLDACFDSVGRDYEKGNFDWGDPNIPEKELKWLKKDLRGSKGPVIVFCHQLLDGEGTYHVDNAASVRKILEQSGKVAAVFTGHYHEGQYRLINNIHYYTLKALVDGTTKTDNSYAIVSVTPSRIKVQGFKNAEAIQFGIDSGK